MTKPGKSQRWIIAGLVLQGIGGVLYASGLVSTFQASIFDSNSGSSPTMPIGALLAFVGWLALMAGLSRASAGLDYLVSVAPAPASPIERQDQETKLAAGQE
jgi:hypothetical protein